MFEVRANCGNSRCKTKVFVVERPDGCCEYASGKPIKIMNEWCPECGMQATVSIVKKVK